MVCGRVGGWENNCGKAIFVYYMYTCPMSTGADGVAWMSNLWRLFWLKLADELEERQRRIIQTREKIGSQDYWSGQDSRLIDIWFTGRWTWIMEAVIYLLYTEKRFV